MDPVIVFMTAVVWAFVAGMAMFCLTLVALISPDKRTLEVLAKAFLGIFKRRK